MNDILATHGLAVWGLYAMALLVLVQSLVAASAHRAQTSYVPGVVAEDLGHDSFVFRSHRTFHNSLENLPMMVVPTVVALLVGMDAGWLGTLVSARTRRKRACSLSARSAGGGRHDVKPKTY